MAIDLAALKAKLAASKGVTTIGGSNEASTSVPVVSSIVPVVSASVSSGSNGSSAVPVPTVNAPAILGTAKTTEIDHIDFLHKMNSLAEAIHKQHPTMPVLLMQIHKQLRADPELVTTLDEEGIGIITRGLQIQTKTELVAEAVKASSPRKKKNAALSIDML